MRQFDYDSFEIRFIRQIHGMDIYDALNEQILHYDVHSSLFDVVMAAVMRFSLLIFFYALLSVNHWFVIAVSLRQFLQYAN